MNLAEKVILITGSNGFLGQHLCNALIRKGLTDLGEVDFSHDYCQRKPGFWRVRAREFDLTKEGQVRSCFSLTRPDVVIHLAAAVGGIGVNRTRPGTFYYKNLMMGAHLLEQARHRMIDKFVGIGTICAYPKHTPVPFKEEDLWNGYPEETNAPYGIAKKAMLVQGQAYRQEFGLNAVHLLPVNLYGPGDNFNPATSHVIPALIRKCVIARETAAPSIECWGTGTATREFLYVEDAAEAIALATEKYDEPEPLNIGNCHEVPIRTLVETVAKLTGFTGRICWNSDYPDGQPRRCLDTSKAKEKLGFVAKTSLEDGLRKTVKWYEENHGHQHPCGSW